MISLSRDFNSWEQITKKPHENIDIGLNNFWGVEISQGSQQDSVLRKLWLGSLELTSLHQHGVNGSESPIVMQRGGEKIPTKGIELGEFSSEDVGVNETLGHQHVLTDNSVLGHHHSNWPIELFKTLWKLGSTLVLLTSWVHGEKHTTSWSQFQRIWLDGESLFLLLNCSEHGSVLLSTDRQHRGDKSVELIEATPSTG